MTQPAKRGGSLSPEQHARIARHLALIPIYLWVPFAWSLFFQQLPAMPGNDRTHLIRDFLHFYAQGAVTRARDAHALYDFDALAAFTNRLVPGPVDTAFPPVYPPQVGLLMSPLSWLPYETALYLWFGVTLLATAACVWLVWRTRRSPDTTGWATTVLLLGAPGLHFSLSFGQASVLALVCFTALWLALVHQRPFLAGVAIGALAYKPQLGVVAAVVCVFGAEWKMVAGAAASVAAQALAVLAYWGTAIVPAYVSALRHLPSVIDGMEPDKAHMHSWRSLLLQLGMSAGLAFAISLVLSVATLVLAVAVWRTRGALALRFAVLSVATVLVNPHVLGYDLLLLLPGLLVTWDWANRHGQWPLKATTALVYAAPILTIGLEHMPVQWSVPAMAGLGTAIWRQLRKEQAISEDQTSLSIPQ